MGNFGDASEELIAMGESLQVFELRDVDSLENDPCVDVRIREAELPDTLPADQLDVAPMDGVIDSGLTLDSGLVTATDTSACIIDGVLHVRAASGSVIPFGTGEIEGERLRIRAGVHEDRWEDAVIGGSIDVQSLIVTFQEMGLDIRSLLEAAADLDPDEAGMCGSLSWALSLEAVPVVLE